MAEKNIVGALLIGIIIGILLLPFMELLLNRHGEDDVADDLEALENGMEELENLVTELNDTLAKSHEENQLIYSELAEWVQYEEQIMTEITDLPLLERKDKPTREELQCYTILTTDANHETPSLDALILEWEVGGNSPGYQSRRGESSRHRQYWEPIARSAKSEPVFLPHCSWFVPLTRLCFCSSSPCSS